MQDEIKATALRKRIRGESFVVQKLNWRILGLTLIFLIGCFLLGELFFRSDFVQAELTGPRIGSRHHQFELQLARLEKLVQEGEPIDCIILGNSMVWLGVDPIVVNQAFQRRTGDEIHCFNFGASALVASSAGQIAPVLIEKYHPKLLIYGTFARDYAIPVDDENAYVVTETPWLRYRNGDFNLTGWLYDHSYVFQYMEHMRDFLYLNYPEDIFVQDNTPAYRTHGLDPKFNIRVDVRSSPDFEEIGSRDPMKWLFHYEIKQENLEGLRRIVQQSNDDTSVIVIEMPFYKTAYAFFSNGRQDYDRYVQEVNSITASQQIPFWRIEEQPFLPAENWWDYFHLNLQGANLFSEWLGNKLADTTQQGELIPSTTGRP